MSHHELWSAASLQRSRDEQAKLLEESLRGIEAAKFAESAGGAAKALFQHIKEFEAATDKGMAVVLLLATFGREITIYISDVGYTQPNLVWFVGNLSDGSPVRLVQHLSQLSFLLMRSVRQSPEVERRPIGFHAELEK